MKFDEVIDNVLDETKYLLNNDMKERVRNLIYKVRHIMHTAKTKETPLDEVKEIVVQTIKQMFT